MATKKPRKPNKTDLHLMEFDNILAAFQDQNSSWEESYRRYMEHLSKAKASKAIVLAMEDDSIQQKLDQIDFAMGIHPGANPVMAVSNISTTKYYTNRQLQLIAARESNTSPHGLIVFNALSKNPLVPVWIDESDTKVRRVIHYGLAWRIYLAFVYVRIRINRADDDDIDMYKDLESEMLTEIEWCINEHPSMDISAPRTAFDVHNVFAELFVDEFSRQTNDLTVAIFSDKICSIFPVDPALVYEHMYRQLLQG